LDTIIVLAYLLTANLLNVLMAREDVCPLSSHVKVAMLTEGSHSWSDSVVTDLITSTLWRRIVTCKYLRWKTLFAQH